MWDGILSLTGRVLNACLVNTAHTKVIMKTVAESTTVKGSFVSVCLHRSHFSLLWTHIHFITETADNVIFCCWGIESLCDRCHWTGWYRASRTLHIMQRARDSRPAWACRLNSTLWLCVGPYSFPYRCHFPCPGSQPQLLGIWTVATEVELKGL